MKRLIPVLMVVMGVMLIMMVMASPVEAGKPVKTPSPTTQVTKTPTPTVVPTNTPAPTSTPVGPTPTPNPSNPHASITAYNGPQTCVNCHPSEADSILHSEHMQWEGKWKEVNTYCTAPEPADFACRSCHVSTGGVTNLNTPDKTDCLICHNDVYKRALGPQTNTVNVIDWTGATKTYQFPVKVSGEYQFQPRYDLMPAGTTMLSLAQNVHAPTRQTCLNCHAKAGGGDGVKRGDLAMENVASTDASLDVHMDADGANLACQDCHVPNNHLIPGTGVDLRVSEGGTVSCEQCHAAAPHAIAELNEHAARVACQTCHIPTFAKAAVGTEMSRDWTTPHWNPAGCNGQGAWIGEEVKAYDVVPTYKFWNGQSDIYNYGESILPENGVYNMAKAFGSINDGKLYPMKVHTSVQPLHNSTNRIVQFDVLWQFMTGKFEEAASRGVAFMGLNGTYSWVTTSADQLITHGVEPKENALQCAACHDSNSQMDLMQLGYSLKTEKTQVCSQCHRDKRYNGDYASFHNRHVDTRGNDCSWCHSFTRPERGLTPDPTP